jgi:hypothetical protein
MSRGAIAQGLGAAADLGIVVVLGLLVGSTLFFLCRPALLKAIDDGYSFLSIRDVLSMYSLRRKPIHERSR